MQDDCGTFYLPIDMQHFQKACGVDEFYAVLEEAPKEALSCMGAAVHMVRLIKSSNFICSTFILLSIRLPPVVRP